MDAATSGGKRSLGDAWAEQMKSRYQTELDKQEEEVQGRVESGKQFIGNEVMKLKKWIRQLGAPAPADSKHPGKLCVAFGALFDAVQDDMQAVSSTCRTARRQGIVDYEGAHLLQGSSDGVPVFLLDDSEDTALDIVVSDRGNAAVEVEKDPFAIDSKTAAIVPCWRCGKDVFPADRVGVDGGRVLHKACFECWLPECTTALTPSRFASIVVEGQWRFYCIPHYRQMFKVGADYEKGFVAAEAKAAAGGASSAVVRDSDEKPAPPKAPAAKPEPAKEERPSKDEKPVEEDDPAKEDKPPADDEPAAEPKDVTDDAAPKDTPASETPSPPAATTPPAAAAPPADPVSGTASDPPPSPTTKKDLPPPKPPKPKNLEAS
ncbi:costars-domain-containing protein [Hyaloraphidium curvatum]|nr:costars-domain-containing protein [Hyaloraphidium curvatum]